MDWGELTKRLFGLRRFGMEPGLERIRGALRAETGVSAPEVITVAGTNGKGTVASLVAGYLQLRGETVGLYTSPHLVDVTERFRVNGVPLSREVVGPVLERLLETYGRRSEGDQGLTFFEITTVAAWALFQEAGVDVAVLEVGLGGRLDGVNGLDPDLSVVTSIGRDHTAILGESIEAIAWEKAGIFRPRVPVVVGPQEHVVATVALRNEADRVGCPLHVVESDAGGFVDRHRETAGRVVEVFTGDPVTEEERAELRARWRWPGRSEEWSTGGLRLFVDGAHNSAGVEELRRLCRREGRRFDAVVWGAMKDKDPAGIAELLTEVGAPVWGAVIDGDRARSGEELKAVVPAGLWAGAGTTREVLAALRAAPQVESVLVFGSLFLLGEVLRDLGVQAQELVTMAPGA